MKAPRASSSSLPTTPLSRISTTAKEVVVLRWEDGKWRAAGYNSRAGGPSETANANGDESGANNNATEVQTQEHVRPTAQ